LIDGEIAIFKKWGWVHVVLLIFIFLFGLGASETTRNDSMYIPPYWWTVFLAIVSVIDHILFAFGTDHTTKEIKSLFVTGCMALFVLFIALYFAYDLAQLYGDLLTCGSPGTGWTVNDFPATSTNTKDNMKFSGVQLNNLYDQVVYFANQNVGGIARENSPGTRDTTINFTDNTCWCISKGSVGIFADVTGGDCSIITSSVVQCARIGFAAVSISVLSYCIMLVYCVRIAYGKDAYTNMDGIAGSGSNAPYPPKYPQANDVMSA